MFSCYEIVQLCRDTFPTCHFAILCSRRKQHTHNPLVGERLALPAQATHIQSPGWGTFTTPGAFA